MTFRSIIIHLCRELLFKPICVLCVHVYIERASHVTQADLELEPIQYRMTLSS